MLEDEFTRLMGARAMGGASVARVYGRASGHARAAGENTVEDIFNRLVGLFDLDGVAPLASESETANVQTCPPARRCCVRAARIAVRSMPPSRRLRNCM